MTGRLCRTAVLQHVIHLLTAETQGVKLHMFIPDIEVGYFLYRGFSFVQG